MNLDPASLRVEATGETRVEISGLESSVQTADPKQTADAFTAKLAALNDEREKLGVAIAALQGERAMIEKFGQSGPDKLGGDGKALAIADWEGAWRAIHDGLAKVDADLAPAKARLADDRSANRRAQRRSQRGGAGNQTASERRAAGARGGPCHVHAVLSHRRRRLGSRLRRRARHLRRQPRRHPFNPARVGGAAVGRGLARRRADRLHRAGRAGDGRARARHQPRRFLERRRRGRSALRRASRRRAKAGARAAAGRRERRQRPKRSARSRSSRKEVRTPIPRVLSPPAG